MKGQELQRGAEKERGKGTEERKFCQISSNYFHNRIYLGITISLITTPLYPLCYLNWKGSDCLYTTAYAKIFFCIVVYVVLVREWGEGTRWNRQETQRWVCKKARKIKRERDLDRAKGSSGRASVGHVTIHLVTTALHCAALRRAAPPTSTRPGLDSRRPTLHLQHNASQVMDAARRAACYAVHPGP